MQFTPGFHSFSLPPPFQAVQNHHAPAGERIVQSFPSFFADGGELKVFPDFCFAPRLVFKQRADDVTEVNQARRLEIVF